jgi:hypothetical protein
MDMPNGKQTQKSVWAPSVRVEILNRACKSFNRTTRKMIKKNTPLVSILLFLAILLSACQSGSGSPAELPTSPAPTMAGPTPTVVVPFTLIESGQELGPAGNGVAVVTGDVDGDGDVDALVSYSDVASVLFLNDGTGVFNKSSQVFNPSTNAALGDLNGDGSIDIFFTGETQNEVWLNNGSGVFRNTNQDLKNFEGSSVALGDLDGDGDLDAFVTNWNRKPDQVFYNDGNGNFTDSGQTLGNSFGCDVALGDVDNDGDLDALVANNGEASDNAPVLWLNDGEATFTDSGQRLGFTNAYAVALGDLDGDGDLDAFIANSSHNGAIPADKVWLNDGKGVFTDSGQNLGNFYSLSLALGDLDNDGDLDVYTGSWNVSSQVWINNGAGIFSNGKMKMYSANNAGVALADIDGDGDLDVFVSTNTWKGGDGLPAYWENTLYP